ncbi:Fatty-acid amide hydrolase 2 [Pseudolycoriella hygida]|uniref:Fatty-acid amide hydrolase 2 n=1 Tax=Pseudolycoriella hygida TaxID=35572 RepID=A0A9Q0ND91_9DIPT|nr:Fatty-acid amide hydrolase 2 [Pseudolycoriella hygida]
MSQEKMGKGGKQHSRKEKMHRKPSGSGRIFITYLLYFFHFIKDFLLNLFCKWYWTNQKVCPSLSRDEHFLTLSVVELAKMIRTRELTSYKLVESYINRINKINPVLNAVVDGPFMEALNEAKSIDMRIANGLVSDEEFNEKFLLGIPFTTKDSTAVNGKLHTLGLLSRKATRSKEDAECIRLVKEAGGIILATSNIPEVNKWQETRNLLIGQTNNPYDVRRTVGGSSGGEAALIAACGTAFGIGTDIGGSIRMPAFYCGIFGHKPTVGIVNTRGCTFRTGKEQSTMVVAGPMTRRASDLLPLMKILVGPENVKLLKLNDKVDVKKLRYFYIRESGELRCSNVASDLQKAMTKVIDHFGEIAESQPSAATLSSIQYTSKMWRYWMTQEPADFNNLLGNGVKLNGFIELTKKIIGKGEFTMASIYSLIDEYLPKENAAKVKEMTRKCDEDLTNLLGDDGILFYHSAPIPAPFHFTPLINVYNFTYWSLFNVLHVPATQVPLGLNSEGIPLGLQVIATRNRDKDCLAVAQELERIFNGWVPPFTFV